jgi:hypothetical protein
MAKQSIVDFVRESRSPSGGSWASYAPSAAPDSEMEAFRARLGAATELGVIGPRPVPVATPAIAVDELAYARYASKVVAALQGQPGLTARQIFDLVGSGDYPMFRSVIEQMVTRRLLVVTGQDPKYNDMTYGLSAQAA